MFSASGAASDSDTISVSDEPVVESGSHGPPDMASWGQIQREELKEDLQEEQLAVEIELTLTVRSLLNILMIVKSTNVIILHLFKKIDLA